ncbi:amidohydrolase [Streptomyces sp. AC536]|uniref:amidohydrolase n=1 Tax=Streptomyces buecherae TaxID=2763006 RepID=UPI00164DFA1B|nr:amidohydrolase [Streptomyces buecherae]MBC3984304.1 amidohydrolase [Streptomyces buecherae]QNJ38913.1 amidohydrolase [Streptomyces buecherae]
MLDLRLTNGTFHTMDRSRPRARSLGVWRGRIVGVDEAIAGLPAAHEVDLAGATVLPAFIDAHVHLAWTGLAARATSVAGQRDAASVLAVIRRAAAHAPPDAWVDVADYDQRPLGRDLTAAELDEAGGGRKVLVAHRSGHACVVSSAVLALLPPGTEHRDGLLAESGMAAARAARMPYSLAELTDAIESAGRACLTEGITAAAEAGIGGGLIAHSAIELAAYQRARDAGRLPLRMRLMVAADLLREVAAHPDDGLRHGIDLGLRTGLGDDRLAIGALKVFTDGGMMPRTAALTKPYVGLDHGGALFADPAELTATIVAGHLADWQLAIHAIGDRAVDVALSALAEAQRLRPRPGARHRVEHAGLVRPDQLPRLARSGATVVVQPAFLWSFGDDYAQLMGADRADWLYRGRAFRTHGIPLAGSSDRPVAVGAPLRAIQFMGERRSHSGRVIGPDEGLSVDEALRAYTIDAARACHWEHALGSLTPGNHADLVVLSDDPHRVAPSRIGAIEVVTTFSAGVPVYGGAGLGLG